MYHICVLTTTRRARRTRARPREPPWRAHRERSTMPLGDYPVAVVTTALALPPVLLLAAGHLALTASFGPACSAGAGDSRVSTACVVVLLLGFISAGCAVFEEMAELDSTEQDVLRCLRDVFLVAAGHSCYPLAVLVAQTTVWRRKTAISRCLRGAGSAMSQCLFFLLVTISFVLSALACVAWPVPVPWEIGPGPPLRTAVLTAPGVTMFTTTLLLAGCNGSTPWGEGMAVLLGAVCALGGKNMPCLPCDLLYYIVCSHHVFYMYSRKPAHVVCSSSERVCAVFACRPLI